MKNTFKKFMAWTMLLSFALTTPVSSSLALAQEGDLLAYSMDYMPEIRGSQPSIVSLGGNVGITDKVLPISLSLRDSDVKQVLRMFADKAGLNIIFKGKIEGKVTMDLVNIPLNSAFNMVLTSQDLNYTLQDNTLIITDAKSAASVGKQELAVIPVKYINAGQVAHFLNTNIYGMKKPGLSGNYIASSNPATNEVFIFGGDSDVAIARRVISQFDKKPVVTSFKVNHSTPAEMASMICALLLPSTGDLPLNGSEGGSTGGAAGMITGFAAAESGGSGGGGAASKIALGEGAIACSGTVTNSGENSSSGGEEGDKNSNVSSLQLNGITVAYYTQLGTVSVVGGSPYQIEMIRDFIAANDKRQPQAYIEFSIIELSESGTREFDNAWSFLSKHFMFNYEGSPSDGTSSFAPYVFGGHRPVYSTATPQLIYQLKIIMQNGKGRTLSNPRILVTNGQESVIDLTEDYVKTVKSQIIQGTMSNVPTVERTYEIGNDLGLKIAVTPFISPDGYVYLNVKPEYTTKSGDVKAKSASGDEDLVATLLRKNNLELKNIRIKDGDTLVLGGMMKEIESKDMSKIPLLGDIPGLGSLFRSTRSEKEKLELVILITPKIITDEDFATSTNENSNGNSL